MTKLSLVAVIVMLVGCGPDFSGSYNGLLAQAGSCSDGSSGTSSDTVTWTLSEEGRATFTGACSPIETTARGNVLTMQGKTCTPTSDAGVTYTLTITDGTATLNGDVLAVAMHNILNWNGAASGHCNITWSGNLTRN